MAPFATASPMSRSAAARRRSLVSGPTSVSGSRPSPTRRDIVARTKLSVNASATDSWTKNRLGEAHTCPAFLYFARTQDWADNSTSASEKMSTGACPPSSIVEGIILSAAACSSNRPTGTEPVSEIFRTTGDWISRSLTIAGFPESTPIAAGLTPASRHAWAMRQAVRGVSSAGTTMTEQPAARAGAIFRAGSRAGKFHVLNATTGPIDSRVTSSRCPFECPSMVRP